MPYLMGDCFLLCSDGLSNHVDLQELSRFISSAYYAEIPKKLVELANHLGGDDNITIVLSYVANDARERETMSVGEFDGAEDEFDPYAVTLVPELDDLDDLDEDTIDAYPNEGVEGSIDEEEDTIDGEEDAK
jgi:protein phosphatase